MVRGDVELHVRQRDWSSHGHTQDPNYNGVVLHAALEVESDSTGLHSGGNAPVVSLAPLLDEADHQDPGAVASDAGEPGAGRRRPGRCFRQSLEACSNPWVTPVRQPMAQAGELLDRAGDQRFQARVREFAVLLEETGLAWDSGDEVLYEGLMEGLGYKANRQGFLSLANRTPWRRLVELTAGMSEEQAFLSVRGWMVQVSGLNRKLGTPASGEKLPSGIGPALGPGDWRLAGLRPANHPIRRMVGVPGWCSSSVKSG